MHEHSCALQTHLWIYGICIAIVLLAAFLSFGLVIAGVRDHQIAKIYNVDPSLYSYQYKMSMKEVAMSKGIGFVIYAGKNYIREPYYLLCV